MKYWKTFFDQGYSKITLFDHIASLMLCLPGGFKNFSNPLQIPLNTNDGVFFGKFRLWIHFNVLGLMYFYFELRKQWIFWCQFMKNEGKNSWTQLISNDMPFKRNQNWWNEARITKQKSMTRRQDQIKFLQSRD